MKSIVITIMISIIFLASGSHALAEDTVTTQAVVFKLLMSGKRPQIAIWIADNQGAYIETVYVTRITATKGYGNREGTIDAKGKFRGSRLSMLPVWAHSRGIDYGNGNFYPTYKTPLPDAITSATPREGEFKWNWTPKKVLKHGRYSYYVEVNECYDHNEHHNYSHYRGQPSVVWQGRFLVGDKIDTSEAKIIGHGHVAGEDGQINPDVTTLTTSLGLIEKVTASFNP